MTGYGRGEAVGADGKVTVEIKTLNHRYCDVVIRLPRAYISCEDALRRLVREEVVRGRVDVYVEIEEQGSKNIAVSVDKELATAYYKAMEDLRVCLGLAGTAHLQDIVLQPGVLKVNEIPVDVSRIWPLIEGAAREALRRLCTAREVEGRILTEDIRRRLERLASICGLIEGQVPEVARSYRERLAERLKDFAAVLGPERLAAEVALLAERADISEEVVRIKSHIARAGETLTVGGPVGRQLDFLLQEIFRELNTIGAKAQNLSISQLVIEAKSEVEKMREQVQNLE
ncbi:YicC/YloC family endoribonuclease [Thermodesulfitimonas sp.]